VGWGAAVGAAAGAQADNTNAAISMTLIQGKSLRDIGFSPSFFLNLD
jgi:2-methylcitrate dehydratase PrpD